MPKLRTATGRECPCDVMTSVNNTVLYVKIQMDLSETITVFQDPEETKVLQWIGDNGNILSEEKGYTKFVGITMMPGSCPVRVRLDKDLDALILEQARALLERERGAE